MIIVLVAVITNNCLKAYEWCQSDIPSYRWVVCMHSNISFNNNRC